ncbi:MAG: transcriptional regulator [Rubritepida sp.]|nr:transcriptional regulator [Rubritepida sp.]
MAKASGGTLASGTADSGGGVAAVKSIEKAFALLESFRGRGRMLSLNELAVGAGLDKSSAQRVTRTLRDLGYLHQDPATRRYYMAPRVLDLSYDFLRTHPLIERALPVVVELQRVARERVDLVLSEHNTVVYVLRMQAKRETFKPALFGRRVPMFCTAAGRAIMSGMAEDEAEALIAGSDRKAYTRKTLTEPHAIMAEVRKARDLGYCLQAEEWLPAEMVLAVPVLDAHGKPYAALNVAVSTRDWTAEAMVEKFSAMLMSAAMELNG